MEMADSDLLFIDVDASTPAVKQEQDETPEPSHARRMPIEAQVSYLVDCMEKYPELARGCIRSSAGRARARRVWEQVRARLNAVHGGVRKNCSQWMKYWTDKKTSVKKKAAEGEVELSALEEKILYLCVGVAEPTKLKRTEELDGSPLAHSDISDNEGSHTPNLSAVSAPTGESKPIGTRRAKRVRSTPELRFKCNTCSYVTYHRALFREHKNRHEGIKPYKCELCPYSSVSKKYVKQHQARHRACACGHVAGNNKLMRRHLATCGARRPDVAHTCPKCRRDYVDEKALAKHSARSVQCPLCEARECAGSLRGHMTRQHDVTTRNERTPFECSMCSWRGGSTRGILLHLIHHPQPQPTGVDTAILTRCGILA